MPDRDDHVGITRHLDLTLGDSLTRNLALEDALLQRIEAEVRSREAVPAGSDARSIPSLLRFWSWPELAVVLGASGRLEADVQVVNCRRDGIAIARRSSGGGTVLLGPGVLCVTWILPIACIPGGSAVDRAQLAVLERTAEAIRNGTGLPVAVRGSGDLVLDGRKCAGSAQRRLKQCVLIHASILHGMPAATIATYLREPARQPAYRAGRSHDHFVTNLPAARADLVAAIAEGWLAPDARRIDPADLEPVLGEAGRLDRSKFSQAEWISRF